VVVSLRLTYFIKEEGIKLMAVTAPNVNQFQFLFTGRHSCRGKWRGLGGLDPPWVRGDPTENALNRSMEVRF